MFETILIRPHIYDRPAIDLGMTAETLLFYDHVHIAAPSRMLAAYVQGIGTDNILRLLDMQQLTITCLRDHDGVRHETRNGITFHRFTTIEPLTNTKRRLRNPEILQEAFEEVLGRSKETRRFVKEILGRISFRRLSDTIG